MKTFMTKYVLFLDCRRHAVGGVRKAPEGHLLPLDVIPRRNRHLHAERTARTGSPGAALKEMSRSAAQIAPICGWIE